MSRAARVLAGNPGDSKNRLFSAPITIPSPRFPEHDFPRLTTGEKTEIEKAGQAHNTFVSTKQTRNNARTETPRRKNFLGQLKSSRIARVVSLEYDTQPVA